MAPKKFNLKRQKQYFTQNKAHPSQNSHLIGLKNSQTEQVKYFDCHKELPHSFQSDLISRGQDDDVESSDELVKKATDLCIKQLKKAINTQKYYEELSPIDIKYKSP